DRQREPLDPLRAEVDLRAGVVAAAFDRNDHPFPEAGVRHVLAHPPGHPAIEAQRGALLGLRQTAGIAGIPAAVPELAPAAPARARCAGPCIPVRTPAFAAFVARPGAVSEALRRAGSRREPL